ncbi:hypothetical protein DFH09DRAFT_1329148 [Mycena vulgaris]|nr:hypothetical protein DFH09DRAFT_1329148 [Mycena vulgaris]
MPSDESEHSLLFLGPPPATFEREEKKVDAYDPPFLFGTLGNNRVPRQRRKLLLQGFLSKLMGWPALVICGQFILQAGAWGFLALLQSRRGIPLPYRWASWAHANPHIVDWITTVIATILAFFTTALFSLGVRKSTALHLHGDGMSLAAFIASIKISTRSLILDRDSRRRKLALMSIVIFILTGGVQTAGWKALITPYAIDVFGPLAGYEIDLSSPLLGQLQNNEALDDCVQNSTSQSAFIVGQTDSGYAAAKGVLSIPATFTVMDHTVNLSTAGILPLTLKSRNSSTWFPNTMTIPATVKSVLNLPNGLDSWYSLTQQGFTADVSCKYWDPTDASVPSILIDNTTVKNWNSAQMADNITFSDLRSDCEVDYRVAFSNWSRAYTLGDQPNYLLMIACPSQDNYKLIFNAHPGGIYGFINTTVCTLSPKITNVEVYYTKFINTVTRPGAKLADVGGPLTLSAVETLYNMVFFSQSSASNGMGDKLRSLIEEVDGVDFTRATTMRLTEEYIRGVTEYSASVFRACLSANEGFLDALPSRMNVSTEGTFHSDTVGWIHASPGTFLELIPGTLMAIFAIYAVVTTLAYHPVNSKDEPFDPSDPMHLMAASAAGHLNKVFTGTKKENILAVEEANGKYIGTLFTFHSLPPYIPLCPYRISAPPARCSRTARAPFPHLSLSAHCSRSRSCLFCAVRAQSALPIPSFPLPFRGRLCTPLHIVLYPSRTAFCAVTIRALCYHTCSHTVFRRAPFSYPLVHLLRPVPVPPFAQRAPHIPFANLAPLRVRVPPFAHRLCSVPVYPFAFRLCTAPVPVRAPLGASFPSS